MSRPVAQPLRLLTEAERHELQRVSRAPSEAVIRHQRAVALLAVANGMFLIEAARSAGWRVHDTVTRLVRRFNERGLLALDDLPRSGHPRSYGPAQRARIEQELQRSPLLKEDGTATWSLTTLQRSLREAADGLPEVSTFTILHTIHEVGYTWQKNRTWCKTGFPLHKTKEGVEERYDPYTQEKKR
jgi:transposase